MFQSFTGHSRRPRQVNLSGQNNDPFAATAWTPTASGTQKTVAAAQQERLQRQQERERLNAAKTLQRTWRGHKTRKELADGWREAWDNLESSIVQASSSPAILPEELTLLLAFFSPRKQTDIQRLAVFGNRVSQQVGLAYFSRNDVQPSLLRLTKISLDALARTNHYIWLEEILGLVMNLWKSNRNISSRYSRSYYKNLSRIVSNSSFSSSRQKFLLDAVQLPLMYDLGQDGSGDDLMYTYCSLGIELLTTPHLLELLGPNEMARRIDTKMLSVALLPELTSTTTAIPESDNRLWLAAQFIALCRLQSDRSQESEHLRLLSVLFSSLGDELFQRFDTQQKPDDPDDEDEDRRPPLPKFVADQIATLAEKESIVNLFSRFHTIDVRKKEDAALLASYALTLLRVFARRGDEIRMWLHYSSLSVKSDLELPAVRFFWQAVIDTDIFKAIPTSTDSSLAILKSLSSQGAPNVAANATASQEWHVIMLFLELYAFGLRFTDDEEFLAGGNVLDSAEPMSRFGKSALPLEDVKWLTMFLKNLAFTMIFNANEIIDNHSTHGDGNLSAYLAAVSQSSSVSSNALRTADIEKKVVDSKHQTNIAGMAYSNVRELVTSVLRALYERDSRRRFIPQGAWLMTSKFDMGSFIPAVVAEEERRREVDDTGDHDDPSEDEEDLSGSGIIGLQRPSRAVQMERLRRQQRRAARTRALAAVGPRLEILQNMPFVIPFSTRVQIFSQFVLLDQTRRRGGHVDPDQWRMSVMMNSPGPREVAREALSKHHARIKRESIFEDAMDQFYGLGEGLKEPIQITFVDRFDTVEAGIDGGGVTKEFLTSITNEAFRTTAGQNRFVTNEQNLLYPNPAALEERKTLLKSAGFGEISPLWNETMRRILQEYEFMGRIVGKCLYEGILIDISFAGFFLLKWALSGNVAQYRANINDLRDLDEELYRGLLKLKNYPGDVEEFGLDFTIEDVVSSPGEPVRTVTRNLMPNGSNIPVTKENRISYISLVTRHRLQIQPFQQTQAFLRGLGEIIKPTWLSMFNQSELQTLIGGDSSELDIEDLRRNTEYGGTYILGDDRQEHQTVQFFWQVMKELDDTERRKVLKYVTSTPRAPLLGFGQLNPKFSIRDAGSDETRLPSTSTCVNLLKLPMYSKKRVLKQKLLYAVNSGAGFDLS